MEALLALRNQPGWAVWEQVLETMYQTQAGPLGSNLAEREYAFTCGVVHTLRVIAGLPDLLSQKLEAYHGITRPADQSGTDPGPFLNTPYFDGWRRSGAGSGTGPVAGA